MGLCWLSYTRQTLGGCITPTFSSYQSVPHALKESVPWDKNGENKHDEWL